VNLLQNSVDALKDRPEENGPPRIWFEGHQDDQGVTVTVGDNGSGIDPSIQDKIFDPFFTTKEIGQGLGLGLSISYRILQQSGGRLSVRSQPGQFTEMTVHLLAARAPVPASPEPVHAESN
jgi:C4-dicarboxylate-specific signal transduction histidine kinase